MPLGRLTEREISKTVCKCEYLTVDEFNALQAMTLGTLCIAMSFLLEGPLKLKKWSYQLVLIVKQSPVECRKRQIDKQINKQINEQTSNAGPAAGECEETSSVGFFPRCCDLGAAAGRGCKRVTWYRKKCSRFWQLLLEQQGLRGRSVAAAGRRC